MKLDHTSVAYPFLPRRVYAAALDGWILVLGIAAIILFVGPLHPSPWVYFSLFAILSLIEPVLISTTGGSIGHHVFGIRIIDQSSGNHIGFFRALVRSVTKYIFGVFSLFFISTTKRYQALHDLAVKSLVILKDPSSPSAIPHQKEQLLEEALYQYPSLWRRGAIITLYSVISLYILLAISMIFVTGTCSQENRCSRGEDAIFLLGDLASLVVIPTLMIFGVKGRLWGAKRKKLVTAEAAELPTP